MSRKAYPSDVSDEEWAFVAPYLTLMRKDAPQREHSLPEVFNDLRALLHRAKGKHEQPTAATFDGRTVQSTPENGGAGYDGYKRKKGSKIHLAVDTLGYLLALKVTPANEQERQEMTGLPAEVQAVTGENVKVEAAKKGFVLLPRRWVVERSFGSSARFRRLVRDFERSAETLAGLHFCGLCHADAGQIRQNHRFCLMKVHNRL